MKNRLTVLLKNSRKNSLYGRKARRDLGFMAFAVCALAIISTFSLGADTLLGELFGLGAATLAIAPIVTPVAKSRKELISEKRLALQKNLSKHMKALDEDGQAMLQSILDEIDQVYATADEEGASELLAALQGKVDALVAAQPTEEATATAEKEMQKLKDTVAELRMGKVGGGSKEKTLREVIRENADKIKGLKGSKTESLTLAVKAATMTTGSSITSNPQYLPTPEVDSEIGRAPQPVRTILQDVDTKPTSATRIVYVDELPKDGNAAFIKEGTLKPAVSKSWRTSHSDVRKVAVTSKISTEMLEDIDFVEGEVENLARECVETAIAQAVLTGNGTDPNLLGVIPQVGGFITPAYASSVKTPNTADVLMVAASQIRDLGYSGQLTAYLNSSEINKMKLIKDANGNYMSFGTVLEGITVKPNPDLTAGQFLLGDFSKIHVRIKKDIVLEWGYGTVEDAEGKVKSDWEMNFTTLRCEARLASYIKTNDLKAFVCDNLDTVKADIALAAA